MIEGIEELGDRLVNFKDLKVTSVESNELGVVELVTGHGFIVRYTVDQDPLRILRNLIVNLESDDLIDSIVSGEEIEYVDLRYGNKVYTKYKEVASGPWLSDLSYVGKLPPCYPPGCKDNQLKKLCDNYLTLLYEKEWFGSDPDMVDELIREVQRRIEWQAPSIYKEDLRRHCQLLIPRFAQRARAMLLLLRQGFESVRLFGEGWDLEPIFRPLVQGELCPGEPVAQAYRTTKINLHINGDTNVHQRVFECLACGGFLLVAGHDSDKEPGGLYEFLTPGKDFVVFKSLEQLVQQVSWYLSNEEKRLAIARAGQETVLKKHTYPERLKTIISEARKYFKELALN